MFRARPRRPRARTRPDVADRLTAAVIAVAACALAVYTYAATNAASAANGQWQDAVRAEARYTSATLENIRKVYGDDAPLALSITATLVRAQELDRRADAGSFLGVLAAAERDTARTFLDTFRRDLPDSPVTQVLGSTDDPEAVAMTHPFGAQLAALQVSSRHHADAAAELRAAGDDDASRVRGYLWGMVASALVVLAGFLVWERWLRAPPAVTVPAVAAPAACDRWPAVALVLATLVGPRDQTKRRSLPARLAAAVLVGAAVGGIVLRNDPAETAGRSRSDESEPPAAVVGPPPTPAVPPDPPAPGGRGADRSPLPAVILAILAVVATALQIDASSTENRYLAAAAGGANRVGMAEVGSGPREAFLANGRQSVVLMGQRADDVAEEGHGSAADGALAAALADADRAAAARIDAVVAELATPPTSADGLDSLTTAAVSASFFDRDAEQRVQTADAAVAKAAGDRSDGFVLVLLALTLAANLVEIGHSSRLGRAGPYVVGAGWVLAVVAALLTSHTLLTG